LVKLSELFVILTETLEEEGDSAELELDSDDWLLFVWLTERLLFVCDREDDELLVIL